MALKTGLLRRVQASKDQDYSDVSDSEQDDSEPEEQHNLREDDLDASQDGEDIDSDEERDQNDEDASMDDDDDQDSTPEEPDSKAILSQISFGDLATAQASLNPSKKRKRGQKSPSPSLDSASRSPSPFHEATEREAGKSKPRATTASRSSKHAPVEQSSKRAVSRKRTVIATPKLEARDPRFSNLSGGLDANKVKQNYAFLNEYRASEIQALKEKVRQTKDVKGKERLKRELRAMEDRERARKIVDDERDVVREHRKKESERVRQGKKPFFLKKGEIKRQVLVKRFEGMGERKAEKVMERRRKKKASREKRDMPRARREVE